jgi:hypothetical protein
MPLKWVDKFRKKNTIDSIKNMITVRSSPAEKTIKASIINW